MNTGDRFKVKDSGSEWLIFDTLSPVSRYIGVTTLVKYANDLQRMALRWEDKLTTATNENNMLIRENAELQATMVHPGDHMDALDELRETLVSDYAQRMKEQAAQHAEEVAELKGRLQYADNLVRLAVADAEGEPF